MRLASSQRPAGERTAGDALVLVVGGTATAREATMTLEPAGVTTVSATSGRDALTRASALEPDLIVMGGGGTHDMTGGEVLRELGNGAGRGAGVVVLGRPEDDEPPAHGRDYLPADVGVDELADHLRVRLNRPSQAATVPPRPAVSEPRLAEEIDRELGRARRSRQPGVLAAVVVPELEQLRRRLGAAAEQALDEAFDRLLALDELFLERHSTMSGGGLWVLMPETDAAAASERLLQLSRRVVGAVLDIAGEHVRVTPAVGYATFSEAGSVDDLRRHARLAAEDATAHLDLVPVAYTPALAAAAAAASASAGAHRDRLLAFLERLRSPLQVAFTLALLLSLPFIVYVLVWDAGYDLTNVTYPLMALALAGTAAALWAESCAALGAVEAPERPGAPYPTATAIIAAYLPNEAATIVDTITTMLAQEYQGELQVILAYNAPRPLPVEAVLTEIARADPRLLLLRVEASTSKAQNVNAALTHVRGRFVGVFDADHHPAPGSFARAWRWLSNGHDVVQGHCVVRNGETSWVARLIAVEFETIYAVSHPGRARLHGFGIFGGSNGYWRREALQRTRMQRSMLTEDIDSSMRGLQDGLTIVSDPELVSTELAPTTLRALWHQRMRWAQGWTQTARRHLVPALTSSQLTSRQRLGALFLLGWAQVVPWITIQVVPILAFTAWRDGGLGSLDWLVPLFVLLSIFTFSVGAFQTLFAYLLGDERIRRHRGWFLLYALHSITWFGELKNLIARVAQLKELTGERQWRVTPRSTPALAAAATADPSDAPAPPRRSE